MTQEFGVSRSTYGTHLVTERHKPSAYIWLPKIYEQDNREPRFVLRGSPDHLAWLARRQRAHDRGLLRV